MNNTHLENTMNNGEKQAAFAQGMRLMEETFGNGKDNLIALATIANDETVPDAIRPAVRTIDAYYENATFYAVTFAKSNKMQQIAKNPFVSVAGCTDMFTASAKAENLGWVLLPQNAELRQKLRTAFAQWYDMANDEQNPDCCFLAIHLEKGILNINHWEKLYPIDFINQTMQDG